MDESLGPYLSAVNRGADETSHVDPCAYEDGQLQSYRIILQSHLHPNAEEVDSIFRPDD
jgi:hypothetical protein